jgi:hypothetical protein
VPCTWEGKALHHLTGRHDHHHHDFRTSEPGDVLGLRATVSQRRYEVTAEMTEPGRANFIGAGALFQFLHDHAEVAIRAAQQFRHNYYSVYEDTRTRELGITPGNKLAKTAAGLVSGAGRLQPFFPPASGANA